MKNAAIKCFLEGVASHPEEAFRLAMDLTQGSSGALDYDRREKDTIQNMMMAFVFLITQLNNSPDATSTPLSVEYIDELHQYIKKGYMSGGEARIYLGMNATERGIEEVELLKSYGVMRQYKRASDEADVRYYGSTGTDILNTRELVQHILDQYNRLLSQAQKSLDKIYVIATAIALLVRVHPYKDGNARTFCILLLNKCLMENNFSPTLIADPNRFDAYSIQELVNEIIQGQRYFKDIFFEGFGSRTYLEYQLRKPSTEQDLYPDLDRLNHILSDASRHFLAEYTANDFPVENSVDSSLEVTYDGKALLNLFFSDRYMNRFNRSVAFNQLPHFYKDQISIFMEKYSTPFDEVATEGETENHFIINNNFTELQIKHDKTNNKINLMYHLKYSNYPETQIQFIDSIFWLLQRSTAPISTMSVVAFEHGIKIHFSTEDTLQAHYDIEFLLETILNYHLMKVQIDNRIEFDFSLFGVLPMIKDSKLFQNVASLNPEELQELCIESNIHKLVAFFCLNQGDKAISNAFCVLRYLLKKEIQEQTIAFFNHRRRPARINFFDDLHAKIYAQILLHSDSLNEEDWTFMQNHLIPSLLIFNDVDAHEILIKLHNHYPDEVTSHIHDFFESFQTKNQALIAKLNALKIEYTELFTPNTKSIGNSSL